MRTLMLAAAVLAVHGNHLVNGSGQTVRLLGVNHSGTEYACIQGWGIFDGPVDADAISAMTAWHVNAVRVPLNEDCWLGINGVKAAYGGASYRSAVKSYVARLHAAGLAAILELHWNAPGKTKATGQQPMPDKDHSIGFWHSVARAFRSDHDVIFDLYNEPHDVTWKCWRDGCGPWVGMQKLVLAVRSENARQPIMLGGLGWSNDLSGWLKWRPFDPHHALVASFHTYNFNGCITASCWNATVGPIAKTVPVVTGEIGENDCAHGYIDDYMSWADAHAISYLGWTWNTWDCSGGPALISSYDGTPTAFGVGFRDHLASVSGH